MSERFRAFVAAPLSEAALKAVTDFQGRLRTAADMRSVAVRWTVPDQLHLTLKFLGNVDRTLTGALATVMTNRAAKEPALEAALAECSTFGAPERARVLFIRIEDPSGRIGALAENFDLDAAALSLPRESRPYVPHITLGRLSRPTDVAALLQIPLESTPARFDSVRLYESRLSERGSRYTVLSEARFMSAHTS